MLVLNSSTLYYHRTFSKSNASMLASTKTSRSLASRRSPADLARPFCSLASTSLQHSHGAGDVGGRWQLVDLGTGSGAAAASVSARVRDRARDQTRAGLPRVGQTQTAQMSEMALRLR